jgi:hypothetical protein
MHIIRIVAHADFDGLISALFLQEALGVEEVVFTEPWHVSDGSFQVHQTDAVAGLPYPLNGCGLWFDHHSTNARELLPHMHFAIDKKSCAALIYATYAEKLPNFLPLLEEANKIGSADYTEEDLQHPTPAMQISLSLSLGNDRYRSFLLDRLREHTVAEVAALHPVQERYQQIIAAQEHTLSSLEDYARMHGDVLVVDLTQGLPYTKLLPFILGLQYQARVILFLLDDGQRLRVSIEQNIFLRTNTVDIGALMASYGGGGHKAVGGCSIPKSGSEEIIARIIAVLNQ